MDTKETEKQKKDEKGEKEKKEEEEKQREIEKSNYHRFYLLDTLMQPYPNFNDREYVYNALCEYSDEYKGGFCTQENRNVREWILATVKQSCHMDVWRSIFKYVRQSISDLDPENRFCPKLHEDYHNTCGCMGLNPEIINGARYYYEKVQQRIKKLEENEILDKLMAKK